MWSNQTAVIDTERVELTPNPFSTQAREKARTLEGGWLLAGWHLGKEGSQVAVEILAAGEVRDQHEHHRDCWPCSPAGHCIFRVQVMCTDGSLRSCGLQGRRVGSAGGAHRARDG